MVVEMHSTFDKQLNIHRDMVYHMLSLVACSAWKPLCISMVSIALYTLAGGRRVRQEFTNFSTRGRSSYRVPKSRGGKHKRFVSNFIKDRYASTRLHSCKVVNNQSLVPTMPLPEYNDLVIVKAHKSSCHASLIYASVFERHA